MSDTPTDSTVIQDVLDATVEVQDTPTSTVEVYGGYVQGRPGPPGPPGDEYPVTEQPNRIYGTSGAGMPTDFGRVDSLDQPGIDPTDLVSKAFADQLFENIEGDIDAVRTDVTAVQTDVQNVGEEVGGLTAEQAQQATAIVNLSNDLAGMDSRVTEVQDGLVTTNQNMDSLAGQVQEINDRPVLPPGGTTGQMLVKQSDADGDGTWADAPDPEVEIADVDGLQGALDAKVAKDPTTHQPMASDTVVGAAVVVIGPSASAPPAGTLAGTVVIKRRS